MKENLEIIKEELTGAINQLEFVEGIFKHQNLDASCLEIIEQIKKLQNSL